MRQFSLLFIAILFTQFSFSQEENQSKWSLVANTGLGFGTADNDGSPNYNLNSDAGEFLANYQFSNTFGVSTGFGLTRLSGNGFNTAGNFHHERTNIKIPLLLSLDSNISDNFKLMANFGGYAQTPIEEEFQFLGNTIDDEYDGWNFGLQAGATFAYKLTNQLYLGLNVNSQSDFSDLESDNPLFPDQQLDDVSNFGIGAIFEF